MRGLFLRERRMEIIPSAVRERVLGSHVDAFSRYSGYWGTESAREAKSGFNAK